MITGRINYIDTWGCDSNNVNVGLLITNIYREH